MRLYSRVARWELRGNVLKRELWAHAATCECERCSLCARLIDLSREDSPRIEKLFLRTIRLVPAEGQK